MDIEEKKCFHAHCRCMNSDGQCQNFHYANCNKEYIQWKRDNEDSIRFNNFARSITTKFWDEFGTERIHQDCIEDILLIIWKEYDIRRKI